ncbi:hypothetical protein K439DRAFT_950025 [Ramaria rubella]|nr:hypothetical protein K439DRAFT_950025 [Ramaria rubella]
MTSPSISPPSHSRIRKLSRNLDPEARNTITPEYNIPTYPQNRRTNYRYMYHHDLDRTQYEYCPTEKPRTAHNQLKDDRRTTQGCFFPSARRLGDKTHRMQQKTEEPLNSS